MADETPTGQEAEQATQGDQPTPDGDAELEQELKEFFNDRGQGKPEWIPEEQPQTDPKVFGQLSDVARSYGAFTNAFATGDFQAVEEMFNDWNPEAFNAFLDHMYQQKMESGEWIDRWINDRQGGGRGDSRVQGLQRQIQHLQSQIQDRRTQDIGAAQDQIVHGYVSQIDSLSKQVGLKEADRDKAHTEINAMVANNPQLRAAINSGNFKAVNRVFKDVVRKIVMGPELPDDISE